jgi:predicted Fe-Mo cluster-binding NifX family protein
MRIAVSAEDNQGLDSIIGNHFGRCPYFSLVDLEEGKIIAVESISNPFYKQHQVGQVPAFIHQHKVDIMLSGGMGRRAIGLFQDMGIRAVTGASGTVRNALEQYLNSDLGDAEPCQESKKHAG